jgi:hypothetical protein
MWFERFLKGRPSNLELQVLSRLFRPLAQSQSPMAYNSLACTFLLDRLNLLVCAGQLLREDNALSHAG